MCSFIYFSLHKQCKYSIAVLSHSPWIKQFPHQRAWSDDHISLTWLLLHCIILGSYLYPHQMVNHHLTTNTSLVFNASWLISPGSVLLVRILMLFLFSTFILLSWFYFSHAIASLTVWWRLHEWPDTGGHCSCRKRRRQGKCRRGRTPSSSRGIRGRSPGGQNLMLSLSLSLSRAPLKLLLIVVKSSLKTSFDRCQELP